MEAACLLDLSVGQLESRIRSGRLHCYLEVYHLRAPGMPFAYRRRRRYVTATELHRYQLLRQGEREADEDRKVPRDPDGIRRYWRDAQTRSRARRERGNGRGRGWARGAVLSPRAAPLPAPPAVRNDPAAAGTPDDPSA